MSNSVAKEGSAQSVGHSQFEILGQNWAYHPDLASSTTANDPVKTFTNLQHTLWEVRKLFFASP
jgi:hypothetical protein